MLKILIVGASGYSGVELVCYLNKHEHVNSISLAVSHDSKDIGKNISDIYPSLKGRVNLYLESINKFIHSNSVFHAVFFATDHLVSYNLIPLFISKGCVIFDLSGAFRLKNYNKYPKYYGFIHEHLDLLKNAIYSLPEWNFKEIQQAQLLALPGCYATCIQLALKPLVIKQLLSCSHRPIINAISGVSGAGRKISMINSFCEVDLQPYNIFIHKHIPEITEQLGIPIVFIPHLGAFNRGILATITCVLKDNILLSEIISIFTQCYENSSCIRLYHDSIPKLKSVLGLPFCDIGFKSNKNYLVIVVTEDNLLKGAASQAIQCFNIRFGFDETKTLI
ncbi:N-acetyl-gamma-glutamyl-phosphate reductase [Buchnera aphidicola (Eriosoma lanigerum)]|uniref:N-acetyl-gamma-glutamyl-phosphate reductase n=1 Tax=Buchnera aphidicola TaxID=9 RepID=UPI003464796B